MRQSPHRKLCPLGQTESAQAARYTRDVRRTEHQVPGIDNASHANAGSRPGILYSDARSRLRETGPTDFILLTRPPLCHYTLKKGEGGAYYSYRRAGAFVDTDPTVEVGALVEMDPDSKYPKATLIRGRESMQSIAIGGASLLPTAALAAPGFSCEVQLELRPPPQTDHRSREGLATAGAVVARIARRRYRRQSPSCR